MIFTNINDFKALINVKPKSIKPNAKELRSTKASIILVASSMQQEHIQITAQSKLQKLL